MLICMKKVGIITHYYRSKNYGGVLQAYALCEALRDQGYICEQICYDSSSAAPAANSAKVAAAHWLGKWLFGRKWGKRKQAFASFCDRIPHSHTVYTKDTIVQCADEYDVFVTGSDQVWNLKAYHAAYFLDFVSSGKRKLSYAASLCTDHLEEQEKDVFRNSLRDYEAISVREKNAVELLEPLVSKPVRWVADPVFLLTPSQWNQVCSPRMVLQEYVFCYFLGTDREMRNLARQYAAQKHLKLVTIPHVQQNISKAMTVDFGFGDIRLHETSPEQFVSLIRHAHTVFTDSFHAVAFSVIYNKEFFVFERANEAKMASRIHSVVESAGAEERFCTGERRRVGYILGCTPIDYAENKSTMEALKTDSVDFLSENIG